MVGTRPVEMDTTQLRQAVEDLRIELASLVGRDGLRTAEVIYPAGE
jgi:hypothetical protein